jgi:hypothetical protein
VPTVRYNFVNLLLIILLTLVFSGFQTTFWYQLFGSVPAPLLWLNLVLYMILYRRPIEGILTIYLVAAFLRPFTAMPLGVLWLNLLVVFALLGFVKKRVFWPGSRYFFVASIGITLAYHISYFVISHWFEINPAPVSFFNRFFEIVFTALTAVPVYTACSWLDQVTDKEALPEGIET